MGEKYIDLSEEIAPYGAAGSTHRGIDYALRWLDDNPDQVPGRTITRSEHRDTLDHAVKESGYGDDWERGFNTGLAVSGTKVVPDPEPPNAEKLVVDLKRALPMEGETVSWELVARRLDQYGWVKAGGDDEH